MPALPQASRLPALPSLGILGMSLVAVLSLTRLLAERRPVDFVPPYATPLASWGSKLAVLLGLLAIIRLRTALDRRAEPEAGRVALALQLLAAAMTAWHWGAVDSDPVKAGWQHDLYLAILNNQAEAPHQYRALPYGLTRVLEELTGDWRFAGVAYRWFFTYWFLWGCYRFARLFHAPARALATVAVIPVLYPLSVAYYCGQLTDPLSHALFVLALIYVLEDHPALLAAALALGILAKETVLLVVPAYGACWWRKGWPALLRTAGLGAVCTAVYLAARVPLGWSLAYQHINGTEALMVSENLGIGPSRYQIAAPLYANYLHPFLFVGSFLPFIALRWKRLDPRLKALFATLTPLLLASNLCFGWMYESRNYVPLLPLLATMAMPPARDGGETLPASAGVSAC